MPRCARRKGRDRAARPGACAVPRAFRAGRPGAFRRRPAGCAFSPPAWPPPPRQAMRHATPGQEPAPAANGLAVAPQHWDQGRAHQTIVTAALTAKSSAETPKNACWEASSETMRREISGPAVAPRQPRLGSALAVLVVVAPPDARLVAPLGCAVEPLVHAPEAVQSARIGGIGVVDDAVLERERAHARPLARVRGHVGSGHRRRLPGPAAPRARNCIRRPPRAVAPR